MKTTYVAVCPYYWGRGKDEETARKAMVKAGGKRKGHILFKVETPLESLQDDPYVDGYGSLVYPGGSVVTKL
jgi:hypothetical protein